MTGQRAWVFALALASTIWCSARGDDQEEDALSVEQMHHIHQMMDADGDGRASMAEVLAFSDRTRRQMAGKDIHTVLDEMDLDKDGKVSVEELVKDLEKWSNDGEGDVEMNEDPVMRKTYEIAKFGAADKDKDRLLSVEELPALFFPETDEEVMDITARQTLKTKDADGDGLISLQEFWNMDISEGEELPIDEAEQEQFRKLDTDGDGKLGVTEIKAWESGRFHTEEAMKALFELADEDDDMHVSAEELKDARRQIAGGDAQSHLMEWVEHYEL